LLKFLLFNLFPHSVVHLAAQELALELQIGIVVAFVLELQLVQRT
jgi:hypothetical protein